MNILKMPFPKDRLSNKFNEVVREKEIALKEMLSRNEYDFSEMHLFKLKIENKNIDSLSFYNTTLVAQTEIKNCSIKNITISDTRIEGIRFNDTFFSENGVFLNNLNVMFFSFKNCNINGHFYISKSSFHSFKMEDCIIKDSLKMQFSYFRSDTFFVNTKIDGANFDERDMFLQTSFSESTLCFINTHFHFPESQEIAFRTAKNTHMAVGDKEAVDKYYHLEMSAKRKQKNIINRIIELPVVTSPQFSTTRNISFQQI